ncbi:MAG: hypothetical protein RBU28_05880 [Bacteroidales bacterium]|jgi:cell division protein FtsQ|nr:hypothetical protein [Bacteroidales bacterium]
MRRIYRILSFVPLLYLMAVPVYFAITSFSRPCSGVNITLADSSDFTFVTKNEITNLVYSKGKDPAGMPVKDLMMSDMEERIHGLRELKTAEVYVSVDGLLNVFAEQRNPVMRVMPGSGGDFFVDEEGVVIRRRHLYNPRLHIVGGNVNISRKMLDGVSIFDTSIKNTILRDIYHLVKYINSDSFWSAQIDQIYVDAYDEIDLIPRVGNHVIHFGTTADMEDKFRNLSAFYEKVLPEVGWNNYSHINIEFKDQIVCRRRN